MRYSHYNTYPIPTAASRNHGAVTQLGWIFESQTASELTTVEILVCSLDFVVEHWKHGLRETVKWTPKGTRIHQRWVILIHFIEWTLNWAIFRLHNRLYFISHTKSYNAFKFSTAVCSDASLGCLCRYFFSMSDEKSHSESEFIIQRTKNRPKLSQRKSYIIDNLLTSSVRSLQGNLRPGLDVLTSLSLGEYIKASIWDFPVIPSLCRCKQSAQIFYYVVMHCPNESSPLEFSSAFRNFVLQFSVGKQVRKLSNSFSRLVLRWSYSVVSTGFE